MTADTITAIKKAQQCVTPGVTGYLVTSKLTGETRLLEKPLDDLPFNRERFECEPMVRASTLESLQRENDDLKRRLFPYADTTEISGISWDGKYLIGDKASISAFHEMQNRGLQIDVYKRAYDQKEAALKSRAEAAEAEVKRYREALHIISAGHACPIALANNALRSTALSSTGDTHGN